MGALARTGSGRLAECEPPRTPRTFYGADCVSARCSHPSSLILLIDHLAYGITLQPGGYLEPTNTTLIDAAVRELTEETGIDPSQVFSVSPTPAHIEYGRVPARASVAAC
ncbi:NUDIX domain-containing protein [Streptomyces sp. NPDC056817]